MTDSGGDTPDEGAAAPDGPPPWPPVTPGPAFSPPGVPGTPGGSADAGGFPVPPPVPPPTAPPSSPPTEPVSPDPMTTGWPSAPTPPPTSPFPTSRPSTEPHPGDSPPGAPSGRPDGANRPEATNGDWTDQVTDLIVDSVDKVRARTTGPVLNVAHAAVYGVAAVLVLVPVLVLVMIGVVRLLDWAVPGDVWIVYLAMAVVCWMAGAIAWSRRERPDPSTR